MGRGKNENYFFLGYLLQFTILVIAVGIVVLVRRKKALVAAPGPWRLPIIGNLHQLLLIGAGRNLPLHQRLWELAQKHGPVMQLKFGELNNVIISSAEAAEQVMRTHDLNFASRTSGIASNIIFYGCKDLFFTPYGHHWRQMRKIYMMELLTAKRVRSFRSLRAQEVSNLVASVSLFAGEGKPVDDFKHMLLSLTNTITARSAFGKAPKLSAAFLPLADKIVCLVGGFKVSDLFPSFNFLPYVTGFRSKLVALHRAADLVVNEIINEHLAARRRRRHELVVGQTSAAASDEDETEDLVDVLLNLQENAAAADLDDLPLSMDSVKAFILNVFLAGTDTTATAIEWTMSEMMKNPSVMQRAQVEVRSVFRDNVVEDDRLNELEYLDAVIKETFRLHPPGPLFVPKQTQKEVEINGFGIRTNSRVLVNIWAIGRDPRCWIQPEKFNPERFLNSAIDYKGAQFGFIPFGAGRRMCPGIQFAMTIIQLTLANLLFHFDWKLPYGTKPENLDMTELFDTTLKRKEKLCLIPVEIIPTKIVRDTN